RAVLDAATASHLIGVLKGKDPNTYSEGVRALKDSLMLGTMALSEHSVALSEHSLANLLAKRLSSRKEAEDLLLNSLSYEKREGNAIGIAKVLHSLGKLYSDMPDRREDASEAYDEALDYTERTNPLVKDDLTAKILHSRGSLHLHEGE